MYTQSALAGCNPCPIIRSSFYKRRSPPDRQKMHESLSETMHPRQTESLPSDSVYAPLPAASAPACLAGGGEMGALMRSLDWSKTQLGEPENWPQSLRTSISICLD